MTDKELRKETLTDAKIAFGEAHGDKDLAKEGRKEAAKHKVDKVNEAAKVGAHELKEGAQEAWEETKKETKSVAESTKDGWNKMTDTIKEEWEHLKDKAKHVKDDHQDDIDKVKETTHKAGEKIKEAGEKTKDFFDDLGDKAKRSKERFDHKQDMKAALKEQDKLVDEIHDKREEREDT